MSTQKERVLHDRSAGQKESPRRAASESHERESAVEALTRPPLPSLRRQRKDRLTRWLKQVGTRSPPGCRTPPAPKDPKAKLNQEVEASRTSRWPLRTWPPVRRLSRRPCRMRQPNRRSLPLRRRCLSPPKRDRRRRSHGPRDRPQHRRKNPRRRDNSRRRERQSEAGPRTTRWTGLRRCLAAEKLHLPPAARQPACPTRSLAAETLSRRRRRFDSGDEIDGGEGAGGVRRPRKDRGSPRGVSGEAALETDTQDEDRAAATEARERFHRVVAQNALLLMHDNLLRRSPEPEGNGGSSGDRSANGAEPQVRRVQNRRKNPAGRATREVHGVHVIEAAKIADNPQLEPSGQRRQKADDPTGEKAKANAARVRLCLASTARATVNMIYFMGEEDRDRVSRCRPWPGTSQLELRYIHGMLDYNAKRVHARESDWEAEVARSGARASHGDSDEEDDFDGGRRQVTRPPCVYRVGNFDHEGDRVPLRPVVDLACGAIRFEPEAEVRAQLQSEGVLGEDGDSEPLQDLIRTREGRRMHLSDIEFLEQTAADITYDMQWMKKLQSDGMKYVRGQSMRWTLALNSQAGATQQLFDEDGAFFETVPEPPLHILLNLMKTLFVDLEALWRAFRRGMHSEGKVDSEGRLVRKLTCSARGAPWDQGRDPGRARIDEASNCVIHCACWEEHLRKTSRDRLCQGIRDVGILRSYFVEHQSRNKEEEMKEPFEFSWDHSFERIEQALMETYLPHDHESAHVFAQRSESGVRSLFQRMEVAGGADRPALRQEIEEEADGRGPQTSAKLLDSRRRGTGHRSPVPRRRFS